MRGMTATLKKISEYIKSISPSSPQKEIDKVWLENHQTKITTQLISLNESVKKTSRRKKESPGDKSPGLSRVWKEAATYSPALHCSTIGAGGLNFSVRNGKRWDTAAITTWLGVEVSHKQAKNVKWREHVQWTTPKRRCQRHGWGGGGKKVSGN